MPNIGGIQPIQPTPGEKGPKKQIPQEDVEEFVKVTEDSKQLEQLLGVAHNQQSSLIQKDRSKEPGGIPQWLLAFAEELSTFSDSFDLSTFLHALPDGEFKGTPTQVKAKISQEIKSTSSAIADLDRGINYIQNQLKNPNLPPSERTKLESDLKQAQILKQQLQQLNDLLRQLMVEPGSKPGECRIGGPIDWPKLLNQDENAVINGSPNQSPPGGLINLIAQLKEQWG